MPHSLLQIQSSICPLCTVTPVSSEQRSVGQYCTGHLV